MIDLRPDLLDRIKSIIKKYVPEAEVWAFGSRVTWTAKDYSDLDLVIIEKEQIPKKRYYQLQEAFEESDLPIKVDVLDWHRITPGFRANIERRYEVVVDGEDKVSMSDWQEYSLLDVFSVTNGLSKNRKEFGFGHPFLTFKEIFSNYFVPDELVSLANTTEKERIKCSIKRGDVFITRTSEKFEELGITCVSLKNYPDATFNGFTKRLRPNNTVEIDPEYSSFYFKSPYFRRQVLALTTMTTRASLNNEMLERLTIVLPPIEKQKEIAKILVDCHNKIELNIQTNQTLEQIAQAIFKSWFVDFEPVKAKIKAKHSLTPTLSQRERELVVELAAMCAISGKTEEQLKNLDKEALQQLKTTAVLFPDALVESELGEIPEGWNTKLIGDACITTDFVANGSFKALKENVTLYDDPNEVLYVRTTDFNKGFSSALKYTDQRSYDFLKKSKLYGRETIISNVGDVGSVFRAPVWLDMPMTLGSNAVGLISEKFSSYLFCLFRSYVGQQLLQGIVTGSAQLKFNKTNLRSLKVIWPCEELLENFEELEVSFNKKSNALMKEINSLESLRNTLLPKLLSGEIVLNSTTIKDKAENSTLDSRYA